MQLPIAITRAGSQRVSEPAITKNISSCGVLFVSQHELDIGGPIEYVITLKNDRNRVVNLRCIGKVIRFAKKSSEEDESSRCFEIAATLERYEFVRSEA